jgi:hypothetical protein
MSSSTTANGRIVLAGHDAVPAQAEVEYRSSRTRLARSLLTLLGFWALAPLVFFIPPHIPWVLIAIGGGIYFSIRQWRGEFILRSFAGECPRCHSPLTIEPGTRIRLPHAMDCFTCHHEPALEVFTSR